MTELGLVTIFFFLLGAVLGSFANVLIVRWPQGKSVIAPPSACPACDAKIPWYDNIPVLSWLLLKGRCRQCGAGISMRYLVVEIVMALVFAGLFYHLGWQWVLVEYLIFAFGLVVVSFIDWKHMVLPDVFTLSGLALGLVGAFINPERAFWPAFAGVLMGGGFLWAIAYIYLALRNEEGMGGGDIKLLAWIGAVLTWRSIPFVILASSLIGSVVGLVMAVRTKGGLRLSIPFGPYLALAALLYIFGGDYLGSLYLRFFLPSLASVN